jgi:hypothetical protein
MREAQYQAHLIKKVQHLLPGCQVIKLDPRETQGIPDILILFHNQWAMLEVKMAPTSAEQPNQDYYVDLFNGMSFASFINPDNEEEVLNALQSTLGSDREARLS